jgi:hypothetical protein
LNVVAERVSAAVSNGYDNLYSNHIADFKSLRDRVELNLPGLTTVPTKETSQLLSGVYFIYLLLLLLFVIILKVQH